MTKIIKFSELTCPHCGHQETLEMPSDACQYFYECNACKQLFKPRAGDCCVFCSYGTVPCPSIQQDQFRCGASAGLSHSRY